jgi:hypothetical protein
MHYHSQRTDSTAARWRERLIGNRVREPIDHPVPP